MQSGCFLMKRESSEGILAFSCNCRRVSHFISFIGYEMAAPSFYTLAHLAQASEKMNVTVWLVTVFSFITFLSIIPQTVYEESSIDAEITGKIEGEVKLSSKQIQFTLQPLQNSSKLLVTYFPEKDEDFREIPLEHALFHGSTCTIQQTVEIPPSSTNPAQFDFRQFLLQKQITHQAVLEDFNQINCAAEKASFHYFIR